MTAVNTDCVQSVSTPSPRIRCDTEYVWASTAAPGATTSSVAKPTEATGDGQAAEATHHLPYCGHDFSRLFSGENPRRITSGENLERESFPSREYAPDTCWMQAGDAVSAVRRLALASRPVRRKSAMTAHKQRMMRELRAAGESIRALLQPMAARSAPCTGC